MFVDPNLRFLTKFLKIALKHSSNVKFFQIGRKLIPRYFRSLFDDGVTDCYIVPRMTKESYCGTVIMAECEMASLVSTHTKPFYCIVSADGRLTLDFTFEEQMRIKNWHFFIRG